MSTMLQVLQMMSGWRYGGCSREAGSFLHVNHALYTTALLFTFITLLELVVRDRLRRNCNLPQHLRPGAAAILRDAVDELQ